MRNDWFTKGPGDNRALAALCFLLSYSLLFATFATRARGDEAPAPTTASVLYINGPNWPATRLRVFALEGDTTLRVSDCGSFSAYTRTLPFHGSVIEEQFDQELCSTPHALGSTSIGVATLPVSAGSAKISTEAIFRDAQGTLNVVRIPSLPLPIEDGPSLNEYTFDSIENGYSGKTTYLAILADNYAKEKHATVKIEVRDEENLKIASEAVEVDGFSWYALKTPVKSGNIVMWVLPPTIGPAPPQAKIRAVAFVGFDAGGSPDVIVPTRFAIVTPSN